MSYDKDLESLRISRNWSVEGSRRQYAFGVKCACGSVRDRRYNQEPPPAQIARQLKFEGWVQSKDGWVCPVCVTKQRDQRREKKAVAATKEEEIRLTAAVMAALEKAYNREQGRYRQGQDDIAVAQACKTSPVFVERVRTAIYGPMKTDPEIERIEGNVKVIEEMLAEIKSDLAKRRAGL